MNIPKVTPKRALVGVAVLVVAVAAVLAQQTGEGQYPPAAPPAAGASTADPTGAAGTPTTAPDAAPATGEAADPSPADAGEHGDDGLADPGPTGFERARITAGPADEKEAATQFLTKYLNTQRKTDEVWQASVTGLVAPGSELAATLPTVDLARIPAATVGSGGTVTPVADHTVDVVLPLIDSAQTEMGKATVTLVGSSGRWLASNLDWTVR